MISKMLQWESSADVADLGESSRGGRRSTRGFQPSFSFRRDASRSTLLKVPPPDALTMKRSSTAPAKLELRRSAPDKVLDRLVRRELTARAVLASKPDQMAN